MTDTPDQSIDHFARYILGIPLYPHQLEVAHAILASIHAGHGHLFTVMMARQSGKNQLSAVLEAYLLAHMPAGTIVKAAPTFTPQITISRQRLLTLLSASPLRERLWTSEGSLVGMTPHAHPSHLRVPTGPRIMFYSAAPDSNVVGATADLLLEIDEAQAVAPDKFHRDFRPMASTTNATTVLYGTAWSEDTLLAHQRTLNLQQQRSDERLHFEYDWRTLASLKPAYHDFVTQEIARLGQEHPIIQTQYLLRPLSGANALFTPIQRTLLQGSHPWEAHPHEDGIYLAGMDVAGEDRSLLLPTTNPHHLRSHSQRDSTVITIGRVHYNELHLPCIEVVHHVWWRGMTHGDQYAATIALAQQWNIRCLVIDATGLGAGLASLLRTRLGDWRVKAFTFTRPSKSDLAYQLLGFVGGGRLSLYRPEGAPTSTSQECWQQLQRARYHIPAPTILDFYVDPAEGHDDFLISLALLTHAIDGFIPPAASVSVRPRHPF